MKALHFGRFYNDNFGGLERHVALLLRGLAPSMHVDDLVASDDWSSQTIEVEGYRVYKTPSLGVFAGAALCPMMPWRARNLHRRERYDIVHLHFPDPVSHAAVNALPDDVRIVISWHSDIVRQKNLFKLYRPFLDRIVGRAVAIVAATPRHFASSTQLGAADSARLHVVPYGVDFAPFDDPAAVAAGEKIRERCGARRIIFAVGRHVYYKGFEYLIRAMKYLDESALLMLGGSGPLSDGLKRLAQSEGVAQRVNFLGRVPESELAAHYHAADVFCMPSVERSEGFGLVQVEAMICGKPVVCCELGNGVTYVNRHGTTGLVVPPCDAKALAAALNRLLEDEALRGAMGRAGRARAESEFTLEHMWNHMLKVYRAVLSAAPR
jgi:glycosyltransferase involved in cell wall biosynthesis